MIGCGGLGFYESKTSRIEYRVGGTARSCSIEYNAEQGQDRTTSHATLPWSYKFSAKCGTQWVRLMARKDSSIEGSLVATISRDGTILESDSSAAPYAGDGVDLIHFLECPE